MRKITFSIFVVSALNGCAGLNYQTIVYEPLPVYDGTLNNEIRKLKDDIAPIQYQIEKLDKAEQRIKELRFSISKNEDELKNLLQDNAKLAPDGSKEKLEIDIITEDVSTLKRQIENGEKELKILEDGSIKRIRDRKKLQDELEAPQKKLDDKSKKLTKHDGDFSDQMDAALERKNAAESRNKGIRYFDNSPYVLVYADGKGGVSWAIKRLPDPEKLRTVRLKNMLASLDATLTFDPNSGILTKSKDTADGTVIPIAVIDAIASVAAKLPVFNLPDDGKRDAEAMVIPPPRLYKLVYDDKRWILRGGPGDEDIFLSIVEAKGTPDKPAGTPSKAKGGA